MGRLERAGATKRSVDVLIARLAASQYGVFGREQAIRSGATKAMIQHRLETGRWERPERNVFRLAGTAPIWRQSLTIAHLAWGNGAVVSHAAVAALWPLAS